MNPIDPASPSAKARYIMLGGFLGAGKTTAISKLARRLADRGLRVGLITNDQGRNLVDTAMLRAQGFATEEIPGGCFCCRFNSLVAAAERLTERMRPEVFIAEPVGSCTDLAATVTYPLRRLYGDQFTVAPVSVLVDPLRALRMFGVESGGNFSARVGYVYRKQIEEGDLVIINKCDRLAPAQIDALHHAITAHFPGKLILPVSARCGTGLDAWFDRLTSTEQTASTAMAVDYQVYAEGEASLGWLNGTVQAVAEQAVDAGALLQHLARAIQECLQAAHAEVAHLKMTLSPEPSLAGEIAAINLVRNDFVPELAFHLDDPVVGGQLIINLRAEAAPDVLAQAAREGLASACRAFPTLQLTLEHLEHFQPSPPKPTHRIGQLSS